MLWRVPTRRLQRKTSRPSIRRAFRSSSRQLHFEPVPRLPDWDLARFREVAFLTRTPAQLPSEAGFLPTVQQEWFTQEDTDKLDGPSPPFSLNQSFWQKYRTLSVPLELSSTVKDGTSNFERMQAPLSLFLDWMKTASDNSPQRLYLAQCQLGDLPKALRKQLPTPQIVLKAGKGDIYDCNIWMGLAPTYTPLHRDPNPNLFLQLVGRKVVRLFPPDVGAAIFEEVQQKLGNSSSGIFRGDEMMHGKEKELLERDVWDRKDAVGDGYEAILEHGEALFIPLGWWHSIKGVGSGVTSSVNWWFR